MKLAMMARQRSMRTGAMRAAACAAVLALAVGATATARAGTQIDRKLKLEPGGRFVLDTFDGSVSVMGSNENGADVVVTCDRDIQRDIDIEFQENPGDAEVHARWLGAWPIFGTAFIGLHLHYDVRVPKNTRVEIRTRGGGSIYAFALAGDTELHTSGGLIQAFQLTGNLRANSSGGNIRARTIQGAADLGTSGGGIEADAINGPLRAYTSGGWIRIHGAAGRVEAHTSGGSIEAEFGKGDSQGGTLGTSGGSIEVKLDPAANLEIDASTSGGIVRSDLPLRQTDDGWWGSGHAWRKTHLRGTLGSGGAMLRMHTSGGSIRLSAL